MGVRVDTHTAIGGRRRMEDTYTVVIDLLSDVKTDDLRTSRLFGSAESSGSSSSNNSSPRSRDDHHRNPLFSSIHPLPCVLYFGIFDGHGGTDLSLFCRHRVHVLLTEIWPLLLEDPPAALSLALLQTELNFAESHGLGTTMHYTRKLLRSALRSMPSSAPSSPMAEPVSRLKERWLHETCRVATVSPPPTSSSPTTASVTSVFPPIREATSVTMSTPTASLGTATPPPPAADAAALHPLFSVPPSTSSSDHGSQCHRSRRRFSTRLSRKSVQTLSGVGSTALVGVIIDHVLHLAWLGDSEAWLFRRSPLDPLLLSPTHIPLRPDELKRIEDRGGKVTRHINHYGATIGRVNGCLAVSRSLGDIGLKPFVTSHPESTSVRLGDLDEFIVLASDGLWGLLTPKEVREVMRAHFLSFSATFLTAHSRGTFFWPPCPKVGGNGTHCCRGPLFFRHVLRQKGWWHSSERRRAPPLCQHRQKQLAPHGPSSTSSVAETKVLRNIAACRFQGVAKAIVQAAKKKHRLLVTAGARMPSMDNITVIVVALQCEGCHYEDTLQSQAT